MKSNLTIPERGVGQSAYSLLAAIMLTVCWAVPSAGCSASHKAQEHRPKDGQPEEKSLMITSMPFKELNGIEVYNASGVVTLADSRFLFCDNRTNDALFELRLTPDGQQQEAIIRRPLAGITSDAIDDLEDMTLMEKDGQRYIFVTSSMFVREQKHSVWVPSNGILRVTTQADESLHAENMPGFRDWLLKAYPKLAAFDLKSPDEGGLNIEGLTWDQRRQALLFGVRTPVLKGKILILPIKVENLAGPWETSNLKALSSIELELEPAEDEQGIRGLAYDRERDAFLLLIGKSTSESKAPFEIYEWSGEAKTAPKRRNFTFARKMKPEGLTRGFIGGKGALVIVDDGGGFQVIWSDKEQL